MKKLARYFSIALLGATVIMSSCKKTEDDPTPSELNADTKLSLNQGNGTDQDNKNATVKYGQGTTVLEVTAVSNASNDLKRLYVYKQEDDGSLVNVTDWSGFKPDGNNAYYYEIPNDSRNNFTIKRQVNVSSNQSRVTDKYYFYYTKANDFVQASPGSNVLLGPGTITLTYDKDLSSTKTAEKLYTVCSGNGKPAAYNLQSLTAVSVTVAGGVITTPSGVDIIQQSGTANCGTFDGWEGSSGTRFYKLANTFDYANATRNSIKAAYIALLSTANVTGVTNGDIYVAKLRGADEYALFRITQVVSTPSDNNDYYQFDVKK